MATIVRPFAWLLATGLPACTADADKKARPAPSDTALDDPLLPLDPSEAGPFVAGTRSDDIVTPTGQPLTVQTWYPADADSPEAVHPYDNLISGTALDNPEATCIRPRPVLVFSHGNGGIRYQSMFLTEHLATRGWVVVAPGHEGNTSFDLDTDRWGELALRRPLDLSQSFDWLTTELAAVGGPLEGCVDPSAGFAVSGHSFGGYTAVAITGATITAAHAEACTPGWLCADVAGYLSGQAEVGPVDLADARVWASVPMAPAAFALLEPSLSQSTVPALVMGGEYDTSTSMEDQVIPIYQGLAAVPKHLAELATAGHFTFSDACSLLPSYPDCSEEYLDIPTAHRLIRGATTAFLEEQAGIAPAPQGWLPVDDPIVTWESVE